MEASAQETGKEEGAYSEPLTIDQEYLGLVPRPSRAEYRALEEDILAWGGAHTPILVSRERVILDGHTRYMICSEHGLGYSVKVLELPSRCEEMMFVIGSNLRRRQLTKFQQVELGLRLEELIAAKAKMNMRQGSLSRSRETRLEPVHTDRLIADTVHASTDTVYKVRKILSEGTPAEISEARRETGGISRVYNKLKRRMKLEEAHRLGSPPMPEGVYDVILADPPWRYYHEGSQRGKADYHYSTMSTEEICGLAVPSAGHAVLFLWVPNALLEDGLRVLRAWGFTYLTNFVWIKDRVGLGFYLRGQHELLLLAKKGKMPPPTDGDRLPSVISAPRGAHSAKPDVVYGMVERMYPNRRYLELFSRGRRRGWTVWGLEADTVDRIDCDS